MDRNDQKWAVFWCSLLGPVLLEEIPPGRREQYFQKLSREERLLPSGRRKRVSVRTLRRRYKQLKEQGVAGLGRKRRSDQGKPRLRHAQLVQRAVELKREQPRRSDRVINRILKREFGRGLPRSTLYRNLRRAGATRRKLGVTVEKVRCRWTRAQPNALWVGDFEHGPVVMHHGRAVKTHLSGWIDCYSRYVVEARYYVRENLDILIDSLLRAWGNQGASREIYVDNAKIYHADALKLACTELNVKLLHRPPRDPAAGGLIERCFQTAQSQFEAEVRATNILTLDELNQALAAWLHVAYHQEVHSETGEAPGERYAREPRFTRHVDLAAVATLFHDRVERTVNDDFSDVAVDGLLFRVDHALRGDRVVVEYDPYSALQEVRILSLEGQYLGIGRRHLRERDDASQPTPAPRPEPIESAYLDALRAEFEALQKQRAARGIDFRSARQQARWPLARFVSRIARLLGRKGGTSAFNAQEMAVLTAFHERHERVTQSLLEQAFAQTPSGTIAEVLLQLQSLLTDERRQ